MVTLAHANGRRVVVSESDAEHYRLHGWVEVKEKANGKSATRRGRSATVSDSESSAK